MPYPQMFFALQLLFAKKMAELLEQPIQLSILKNTAFYRILGLDWSLDPEHSVWQAYIEGLNGDERDGDWTYQFYLSRYKQIPQYVKPRWGCFSYEYLEDKESVRLHFSNLDRSGYGPLSSLRTGARIAELRSMFTHIQQQHPQAKEVRGGSWLYNRGEYTRLFPPVYGASAHASKPHLIARGLWGQFLRHSGGINAGMADQFIEQVRQLQDIEAYAHCFPCQVLLTHAPIEAFYAFYEV